MSLQGPNDQDLRKLHDEVTQVLHQRFLISTLAISVYGIVTTWLFAQSRDVADPQKLETLAFSGAIITMVMLLLLFIFSHVLGAKIRLIAAYLQVTKSSTWEQDWKAFRGRNKYISYTKGHAGIFVTLGVLDLLDPFILGSIHAVDFDMQGIVWVHMGASVVYFICVCGVGLGGWCDPERGAEAKWKELNHEHGT